MSGSFLWSLPRLWNRPEVKLSPRLPCNCIIFDIFRELRLSILVMPIHCSIPLVTHLHSASPLDNRSFLIGSPRLYASGAGSRTSSWSGLSVLYPSAKVVALTTVTARKMIMMTMMLRLSGRKLSRGSPLLPSPPKGCFTRTPMGGSSKNEGGITGRRGISTPRSRWLETTTRSPRRPSFGTKGMYRTRCR